jgi:site-specific DNA recombinase
VRVGIYTRLSNDPDGTQTATDRQAKDCRAFAAHHGFEVAGLYEDSDLSGFKRGVVRPDYERMLGDLEAGRIEAVVVWKLDRLTRQPGQFERVVEVCERVGARIHSVHESADMTSPAGLAMLRVGMAFAHMESQTMSLRLRRQRLEAAQNGDPNLGGLRPFGFEADKRHIREDEAALVQEAARRVLAGEALMSICRDWDERGIVTTRGNRWQVTALRRMLVNPRVAGRRLHRGDVYPSTKIPAIVDPLTSERLRQILLDPARNTVREVRSRLLTGFIVCGRCGERLHPKRRKGGSPLYRCVRTPGTPACGGLVVIGDHVDALVTEALLEALDTEALDLSAGDDQVMGPLVDQLLHDEAQLEQLARDHYADRLITREEFLAARQAITVRLEGIRRRLAQERRREVMVGLTPGQTLREAWEAAELGWRRTLLRLHVERVQVMPRHAPTNRFDPERVQIQWRAA